MADVSIFINDDDESISVRGFMILKPRIRNAIIKILKERNESEQ